jgi:hypothetical protein
MVMIPMHGLEFAQFELDDMKFGLSSILQEWDLYSLAQKTQ